jgi:hypothetical protein
MHVKRRNPEISFDSEHGTVGRCRFSAKTRQGGSTTTISKAMSGTSIPNSSGNEILPPPRVAALARHPGKLAASSLYSN